MADARQWRRRGSAPPVTIKSTTVTVTLASGEKVDGVLDRVDDFPCR